MENFHASPLCPIRNVLSRLCDKWTMLVFGTLNVNGTMRFNEIHRSIGDISHRMLSVTLKTLEEDGLVTRTVYPEVPPRVEYSLTPRGESLVPHLNNLMDWAAEYLPGIVGGRTTADCAGSGCCAGSNT